MKARLILPVLALSVCVLPGTTCCGPNDPNPAVVQFEATRVGTTATVRIVGVVENLGGGTFDSGAGQQSVQLYEGTTIEPVATEEFEDLAPGATVTLSYDKENWSTTNEFAPDYRLVIAYDPDIRIDGNPNNDDCAIFDNTLTITASEINALFP